MSPPPPTSGGRARDPAPCPGTWTYTRPFSGRPSSTPARSSCCTCSWRWPRRTASGSEAKLLLRSVEASIVAGHLPLRTIGLRALLARPILTLALCVAVTPVLAAVARHADAGAFVHLRTLETPVFIGETHDALFFAVAGVGPGLVGRAGHHRDGSQDGH